MVFLSLPFYSKEKKIQDQLRFSVHAGLAIDDKCVKSIFDSRSVSSTLQLMRHPIGSFLGISILSKSFIPFVIAVYFYISPERPQKGNRYHRSSEFCYDKHKKLQSFLWTLLFGRFEARRNGKMDEHKQKQAASQSHDQHMNHDEAGHAATGHASHHEQMVAEYR